MKLYSVPLSQLHFVESGEFIVRFITDFENQQHDETLDPEIKYFYDTLKVKSPVYNKALMPIKAKAETQELIALDDARDRKVSTLIKAYGVFEHTDEADEKQAFIYLAPLFKNYRNVARMNFEAESLAIDNMLDDLGSSKYKSHAVTLGLLGHISKLESSNAAFKTKFGQRSSVSITDEEYDAKQLRKDIFGLYNDAAEYVDVMSRRKQTPYYTDILKTMNVGREYYANIIARRKGNNSK